MPTFEFSGEISGSQTDNLFESLGAKIKVIGAGGAGNNTINRMTEVGISGAESIAINTDAQDLLYCNATKKVLIGKELTGGLGAGSIPQVGEEAARESEREVRETLKEADMVFLTCGLGGGTGTGSLPVVADTAKKMIRDERPGGTRRPALDGLPSIQG